MLKVHQNDPIPLPGLVYTESIMDTAYNTIWKEHKPFVRNEDGVDVLIDELSALAYQHVVVVRHEYTRIFQHIQTATYASIPTHWGLVLTGQPGIGV